MFTYNRKQRPITDIAKELCDFIDKSTLPIECAEFIKDSITLVGKQIKTKLKMRAVEIYNGTMERYQTIQIKRRPTVLHTKKKMSNVTKPLS